VEQADVESSPPESGFARFNLHEAVQRGIHEAGYLQPRPIQRKAIPSILVGRDLLGLAETGTGKTAAFALPLLSKLQVEHDRPAGARVLVLAPTRELTKQIEGEFRKLAQFTKLRSVAIYGGIPQHIQERELRKRPEVVVATPGRLLDLHEQRVLKLGLIESLVIDEADMLFEMGFLPDVHRIVRALPEKRQNLMFSATMPVDVRVLAEHILHDAHTVELGDSKPTKTVSQYVYPVIMQEKVQLLLHLMSEREFKTAIVFVRTKRRAAKLAEQLQDEFGIRVAVVQGDLSQAQRERAMRDFRQGKQRVLIATDVVSRGIDVPKVSHVVNFDLPGSAEAYTHRIGRTGRSDKRGVAYTFVGEPERREFLTLEKELELELARVTVPGFTRLDLPRDGGAMRPVKRKHTGDGPGGRRATAKKAAKKAAARKKKAATRRGKARHEPPPRAGRGKSRKVRGKGQKRRG